MTDNTSVVSGFHHVALRVSDFDASVRFYTEVLGFTQKLSWGAGDNRAGMLDSGDGVSLELWAGGSAEPAPQGAILHFALRCKDVAAAIDRVRSAGAEVTVEPKDVDIPSDPPTPVRVAFCKGPDGELIEFFQERAV